MKELLLEVGVEELPARFVFPGVEQLKTNVTRGLDEARLSYGDVRTFSTPRRLAVWISGIAERQADLEQEIKGPPVSIAYDKDGNLNQAGQGFARSQKVSTADLVVRDIEGREYLFANRHVTGQAAEDVLPDLLEAAVVGISFPKNMRWGDLELRYARPIRWLVALLEEKVLPVQIANVAAGRCSQGHRQLSSGAVMIPEPRQYGVCLENAFVIADAAERRNSIELQAVEAAEAQGGRTVIDGPLLDEVCNLVEYPTGFCGQFDSAFLSLPEEVLVTSMKEHQRYFPVVDDSGQLMPLFVGVRNGTSEGIALVIEGNEKVLAARLADAKFFYDEDRKHSLDDHARALRAVVFQEGLGTMADKVERIRNLAAVLSDLLDYSAQHDTILRTALLAKADLTTQMVYEFPELQGTMGRRYAELLNEPAAVATGIEEHYLPKFFGDSVPKTAEGLVVGLADKLDTLAGYFGLGKIPTGSQDPFALRRQALAVVQLLEQHKVHVGLDVLCGKALDQYGQQFAGRREQILTSLMDFFKLRLRSVLMDKGHTYDSVDAVLNSKSWNVPELFERVSVLESFRARETFVKLYTVLERAANLASKGSSFDMNDDLLTPPDWELRRAVERAEEQTQQCWQNRDWQGYLEAMAALETPVAAFFDTVMVMDEDPNIRQNRLALLKRIAALGRRYADFSYIVMEARG